MRPSRLALMQRVPPPSDAKEVCFLTRGIQLVTFPSGAESSRPRPLAARERDHPPREDRREREHKHRHRDASAPSRDTKTPGAQGQSDGEAHEVRSSEARPAFNSTVHAELSAFLASADCSQYLNLLLEEKLDLEVRCSHQCPLTRKRVSLSSQLRI